MSILPVVILPVLLLMGAPAADAAGDVDCEKDLKKAVELIDRRWSFKLFKPGAVDLEAAFRELRLEAKRAKTPEACADVLARFMAKLNDGHSSLQYFPELEWTRPAIGVRSQRERLSRSAGQKPTLHAYVFSRDTTDEVLRTLLPGTEILSVNGTPVPELYDHLEARVSGSTQQWEDYMCDRRLLLGPAGTEVELEIREPGGRRRTVTLVRPEWRDEEDWEREQQIWRDTVTVAKAEVLEGGWGYLRFTTFAFRDPRTTIGRFDRAVDSLLETPGMILDLRGNGGGSVDVMVQAVGRFIQEDTVVEYLQIRQPGQNAVAESWYKGSFTTKPPVTAEPREEIYRGPVVILIDRRCFSACEGFTAALQSIDRALVVGSSASGGGSGWVGGLELPSGALISFSWTVAWRPDGQQLEGNGVRPDVTLRERPRDWSVGRDRVLERAIKALERGEAPGLNAKQAET